MMLYYHSWMFYNHFITTLYHFLGLTYWHSAKVPVAVFASFLLRRISVPNGVQSWRNFLEIFLDQKTPSGPKKSLEGGLWGAQPTRARQGAPVAPWWVVPSTGPLTTASDACKFPNIPKTLGESTKHNSSYRKFQNREIQSKHHHRGVHLPHTCLSDDVWVVHHSLMGP